MSQQPNWKLPLVLAITLCALGFGAYWLEFKHKPQTEEAAETAQKVFDLKDRQVKQLVLFDGKQKITLNCTELATGACKPGDNAKWLIAEPQAYTGDNANANALLSALNNLSVPETISLKDESAEKRASLLKEYGLDSPALPADRRLEVTTDQGKTTLYLGQAHPVGDSTFGLVARGDQPDQGKVYLVPSFFKANLEHDLTYWRDKRLFTLTTHEVTAFQLSSAKGKVSGTKQGEQWTIQSPESPAGVPGDLEGIEALISGVTFLSAKSFASREALAKSKPAASLTFKTAKEPVTIQVFKSGKSQVLATVSNLDSTFELEPNSLARFEKSLRELRLAKVVTSMERFTAKRLEFTGKPLGAAPLTLAQKAGRWENISPGAKAPIDDGRVQTLLDRVSGNRIQEFIPAKSVPAGEADGITLALWDEKDPEGKSAPVRKVIFWKAGGKLYARDPASKRPEAYQVDALIAESLPWSREAFAPPAAPAPSKP